MPIKKLITIYSHITIWATIYGLLFAHSRYLINVPWKICDHCYNKTACTLLIHLFDAPLTLFNLYAAWYGLKRFSQSTEKLYISLLDSVFAVNMVFFCFECVSIYLNLTSNGAPWEAMFTASMAVILLVSAGLSFYIKQELIKSAN